MVSVCLSFVSRMVKGWEVSWFEEATTSISNLGTIKRAPREMGLKTVVQNYLKQRPETEDMLSPVLKVLGIETEKSAFQQWIEAGVEDKGDLAPVLKELVDFC